MHWYRPSLISLPAIGVSKFSPWRRWLSSANCFKVLGIALKARTISMRSGATLLCFWLAIKPITSTDQTRKLGLVMSQRGNMNSAAYELRLKSVIHLLLYNICKNLSYMDVGTVDSITNPNLTVASSLMMNFYLTYELGCSTAVSGKRPLSRWLKFEKRFC